MIPEAGKNQEAIEKITYPSKTYKLDTENKRVVGMIDGIDSVRQAAHKILRTERYANMIYSWNYGSELEKFVGKDFDYIKSAIAGEIKEALYMDDRIMNITNFQITRQGIDACLVSFTAESRQGDIEFKEVISI